MSNRKTRSKHRKKRRAAGIKDSGTTERPKKGRIYPIEIYDNLPQPDFKTRACYNCSNTALKNEMRFFKLRDGDVARRKTLLCEACNTLHRPWLK